MPNITVRLEKIKYGGWENLEVAIDVNCTKDLYLTYPTAELILNYAPNNVRKKIASKSLKAFLGAGRTVGKFNGTIVNKPELIGATAKVALMLLEDFLAIATWESSVNQNIEVAQTLAAGFGDSIRSIAYEQLGIELNLEERQQYLAEKLAHKKQFHELFTKWLKQDAGGDCSAVLWGVEVNKLKKAANVPLTYLDEYKQADWELLQRLNRAEACYDVLRTANVTHEAALGIIRVQNTPK